LGGGIPLSSPLRSADVFRMSRRAPLAKAIGALAVASVIGATAYVSYELGGRVGYQQGYLASALNLETINAAVSVTALASIRSGDHDAATAILEAAVDGAVITYSTYSKLDLYQFDTKNRPHRVDRVFQRVAEYRRAHPSTSPYENVRDSVAKAVESVPEPSSDCDNPKSSNALPAAQQGVAADP
jgi:hypothetical protein